MAGIPTFYVAHARLTKDLGADEPSEGWFVVKGFGSPEIVSKRLYAVRADAQAEAARLNEANAPKEAG